MTIKTSSTSITTATTPRRHQRKKGGTVVPPSDFQSRLTKSTVPTGSPDGFLRATRYHAPAQAQRPAIILNVLIACEESQTECQAFRDLGHIAFSCDIQPCRRGGHPEWHIHGDVTPYLEGRTRFVTQDGKCHELRKWHLIIAHPPCTYLCKVSSRHLYAEPLAPFTINGETRFLNPDRYQKLLEGRAFFFRCLAARAPYLAVENPLPMNLAQLPRPTTYACPSWFGVKYTKKTLYWLRNLPPLLPTVIHPHPRVFVRASRG